MRSPSLHSSTFQSPERLRRGSREAEIFVFRGGANRDLVGHTLDREAKRLPAKDAPWTLIGLSSASDIELLAPSYTRLGRELTRAGYCITYDAGHPFQDYGVAQ